MDRRSFLAFLGSAPAAAAATQGATYSAEYFPMPMTAKHILLLDIRSPDDCEIVQVNLDDLDTSYRKG
jgi:hypothetical protein